MLSTMPSIGLDLDLPDFEALCLEDDVFPVFEPRVFAPQPCEVVWGAHGHDAAAASDTSHGAMAVVSWAVGGPARRRVSSAMSAEFDAILRDTRATVGADEYSMAHHRQGVRTSVVDVEALFTSAEADAFALRDSDDDNTVSTAVHGHTPMAAPLPVPDVTGLDFAVELDVMEAIRAISTSPTCDDSVARSSAPSPDPSECSTASDASTPSPQRLSTSPQRISSPGRAPGSPAGKRRTVGAATSARHAASRKHVCIDCGSRFQCKSKLDRHALIHTGDRPFACFCGKAFNQKSALKNHTRRHIRKGTVPSTMNPLINGLNGFTYQDLAEKLQS